MPSFHNRINEPIMKTLKLLCCLGLLFVAAALPAQSIAQSNGATGPALTVEAGFDGYAKRDEWMPVKITATNIGPDITGEVRFKTTYPGETYARSLNLPSQSQKEITIFAPYRGGDLTVEFVNDTGDVVYRAKDSPRELSQYSYLVGIVSLDPSLLNFLAGLNTTTTSEPVSVAHLQLDDLPEQLAVLSPFDALIFNDIETRSLTEAQYRALAQWIEAGGQLVVGGGPNAAETASGLATLLPVSNLTAKTLPALDELADYVSQSIPNQGPYPAAIPGEVTGITVVSEKTDPLLVSQSRGKGKVTYFALDFGLVPMNGWAGNEDFWRQVLAPLDSTPSFYTAYQAQQSLNDLLANISAATLPSPWKLVAFLLAYLLVLVPVNYIVLKKIKRPELAWITFPALIILFSLIGYIGGFRARGGETILRQISVVRQSSGQAEAAIDTFVGLYSPVRERYTLQFSAGALVQPTDGNNGYKGVKTTTSAPTTIRYDATPELQNFWTDIGSMSTALAHEQADLDTLTLDLALTRQGSNWRISGTVINNSGQPLDDAILLVDDRGVRLPKLATGTTQIDEPLQTLEVQPYSDRTLWGENYYQIDDRESVVRDQIMRGIFWPDDYGFAMTKPGFSGSNPTANAPVSDSVTLAVWQDKVAVNGQITVLERNVRREASSLRIISGTLKEM